MLFWHIGATTAITRYTFRDERMDLRLLLFGAILPDLIDTPIGLAAFAAVESVRLVGHSLLFAAAVMTLVMLATRRGRPRKKWMPVAIGVLIHLFLDAIWVDPETLWWPAFGWEFSTSGSSDVAAYLSAVLSSPVMWAGETLGLGYMAAMARRGGLSDAEARMEFLKTGRISVPIRPGP
jgi:membrane-bound metal-dependent hydrolase YbcI (DUF457 family)